MVEAEDPIQRTRKEQCYAPDVPLTTSDPIYRQGVDRKSPESPRSECRKSVDLIWNSLVLTILITLAAPLAYAQQGEKTPNIILIVADYMGYSDIGSYGATDIRTPALDRLASEGVRFSNYYAAGPVCGPSRAALMSGFYPARVGLENNITSWEQGLSTKYNTLVRELKSSGYTTNLVGKWHLGRGPKFSPLAHGFDSFFGFHTWTLGYHNHKTYDGMPGLYRGDTLVNEKGYLTDLFSEESIRIIEANSEDPFFLYVAYNTALPPYQGPDLHKSRWNKGWNVNQATRADYVAMVEAMDRGIGRILDALTNKGLVENTLVLFTYDHGGRHLSRSKPLFHGFGTLWEGGIRVPLILRWPQRLGGGQTIEQPSIAMDVTATILDVAGRGEATKGLDGSSLVPVIVKPKAKFDRTLFWRFGHMKAVRKGRWKYLLERDTQLLFDLDADIQERHDIFRKHPDIAQELRKALFRWEQSVGAPVRR